MDKSTRKLQEIREEIDALDKIILKTLKKRFKLVGKVAAIKIIQTAIDGSDVFHIVFANCDVGNVIRQQRGILIVPYCPVCAVKAYHT